MTPLFLLPLLVFSVQASPRPADSAPLRLLHRVLHPSLPDQSFFPRGSLLADQAGHAYIEPAPSLQHDLLAFAEASAQLTDALYQLALDPHTAEPDTPWLISSVKACHLANQATEHLVVHLPSPDGSPFALDYFVHPIPPNGACPSGPADGRALATPRNATITFTLPALPPFTGDPVVQVPEKTFLQKYWLYIVIALGALQGAR
ncbi:hypothetical protein BC834DRAFT_613579 [Gloeopeniophorella convolvens]|nr:hypothetical protein BC834DRAFT_613579 [Gloeopeniophorella convolvens]